MTRKTILVVFLIVGVCLSLTPFGFARDLNTIRVAVLRDAVMARLSIDGFYRIEDVPAHKILSTGKNLRGAATAFKYAVAIGGRRYTQKELFLNIDDPGALQVNGRRYHGSLAITRIRNAMTLINYVDLEDYIKGIAVREISHYWPAEALKAQAIVFRTYALYSMKQNASRDFDVTSDVYSQVYGGTSAQRYRITDVIDETAGDVLTYQGKIFPAFYHSTCGGNTEDAKALWDVDLPVLKGVACGYCAGSPHYSWKAAIPLAALAAKLRKAGVKVPSVRRIEISDIDPSGRVTDIEISGPDEERIKVSAKDFRNIMGPDLVKSARFTLAMRGNAIELSGTGWGHGVGLCQWGAYFMAKAGYSAAEILGFYYPGSKVMNIHTQKVY
ncbi:MAG: SpoIID/LytB domain-containing protein [Candidatus Omnitrophota bacterium]